MLQIKRHSHRPQLPRFLQKNGSFLLFLLGMAFFGFLTQIQWMGYTAIGIYALVAYTRQLPSQSSFMLALLALGVVPFAVIMSNWLIAQNFAAYSFVLLVTGVVGLIIELQREPRTNSNMNNDTDTAV